MDADIPAHHLVIENHQDRYFRLGDSPVLSLKVEGDNIDQQDPNRVRLDPIEELSDISELFRSKEQFATVTRLVKLISGGEELEPLYYAIQGTDSKIVVYLNETTNEVLKIFINPTALNGSLHYGVNAQDSDSIYLQLDFPNQSPGFYIDLEVGATGNVAHFIAHTGFGFVFQDSEIFRFAPDMDGISTEGKEVIAFIGKTLNLQE